MSPSSFGLGNKVWRIENMTPLGPMMEHTYASHQRISWKSFSFREHLSQWVNCPRFDDSDRSKTEALCKQNKMALQVCAFLTNKLNILGLSDPLLSKDMCFSCLWCESKILFGALKHAFLLPSVSQTETFANLHFFLMSVRESKGASDVDPGVWSGRGFSCVTPPSWPTFLFPHSYPKQPKCCNC